MAKRMGFVMISADQGTIAVNRVSLKKGVTGKWELKDIMLVH